MVIDLPLVGLYLRDCWELKKKLIQMKILLRFGAGALVKYQERERISETLWLILYYTIDVQQFPLTFAWSSTTHHPHRSGWLSFVFHIIYDVWQTDGRAVRSQILRLQQPNVLLPFPMARITNPNSFSVRPQPHSAPNRRQTAREQRPQAKQALPNKGAKTTLLFLAASINDWWSSCSRPIIFLRLFASVPDDDYFRQYTLRSYTVWRSGNTERRRREQRSPATNATATIERSTTRIRVVKGRV